MNFKSIYKTSSHPDDIANALPIIIGIICIIAIWTFVAILYTKNANRKHNTK